MPLNTPNHSRDLPQNLAALGCVEFPSGIAPSRLRILAGIHVLRSSSHFISHRLGAILV